MISRLALALLLLLTGCDTIYYRIDNAEPHALLVRIRYSDGVIVEKCMKPSATFGEFDPTTTVEQIDVYFQGRLLYAATRAELRSLAGTVPPEEVVFVLRKDGVHLGEKTRTYSQRPIVYGNECTYPEGWGKDNTRRYPRTDR